MKNINKILILAFALIVMICNGSNSTTAYATEVTGKPTTGTEVESCKLTFRIGYLGNDTPDDLTVDLKDIGSDKTYQFVLKSNNGYGASENFAIMANTTYEVTATFPNSDKFEIKNADGSEIKKIHATATGLELYWQIQNVKEQTKKDISQEKVTQDTYKKQLSSEELLKEFEGKVSFIKSDSSYKDFLENWACATYRDKFLEVEENTEDKWKSMSKYEQACYSLLFSYPRMLVLGTNSNIYAKDRTTFIKNLDVAKKPLLKFNNGDTVYNAIVEVWDWHWTNWSTNRTFINPYEGTTYDVNDKEQSLNDFELSTEDKEALEKDTGNVSHKLSSKENFFNIIKNNKLSLIILIVILTSLGIVIYKNKKKNLNNDNNGDNE